MAGTYLAVPVGEAEYLRRRDTQSVTASMNAAVDEVGADVDPWVAEVARRTLERTEW